MRSNHLKISNTNNLAVIMTSDELKSTEKRASDAALEKENMREAMVAQQEVSISNRQVVPWDLHHHYS